MYQQESSNINISQYCFDSKYWDDWNTFSKAICRFMGFCSLYLYQWIVPSVDILTLKWLSEMAKDRLETPPSKHKNNKPNHHHKTLPVFTTMDAELVRINTVSQNMIYGMAILKCKDMSQNPPSWTSIELTCDLNIDWNTKRVISHCFASKKWALLSKL